MFGLNDSLKKTKKKPHYLLLIVRLSLFSFQKILKAREFIAKLPYRIDPFVSKLQNAWFNLKRFTVCVSLRSCIFKLRLVANLTERPN